MSSDRISLITPAQQTDRPRARPARGRLHSVIHGPAIAASLHIGAEWTGAIEVEDIMQVTYLEAYVALRDARAEVRSLRAWLQRAAENDLRDAIAALRAARRPPPGQRLQPGPDEDPVLWLHRQATSGGTTPSNSASRSEMVAVLRAEMANLPPIYADVLDLVIMRGLGHVEAGAKLGRTRGAVYLLQQRAVEMLRRRMGG